MGWFNNKSKTACWKEFLGSIIIILQAFFKVRWKRNFTEFRNTWSLLNICCLLYKRNLLNEIITLAKLCWFKFSKYQYNSENLPSKFGTLKYKIFCSHYVSFTLKRAVVSKQNLPSFLNYGWETVENDITPISTENLPAQLALIELSGCGCKRGAQCEDSDCWIEDKDNVFEEADDD